MDCEVSICFVIKLLLEVVQIGVKNIEIVFMVFGVVMQILLIEDIERYVKEIEQEKQEEVDKKKKGWILGIGSVVIFMRGLDDVVE